MFMQPALTQQSTEKSYEEIKKQVSQKRGVS